MSHALGIRALRGGAALRLSDATGNSLVERQFTSADCRALAEAMAVVVEAYFVDLGPALDRPRPAAPSAADATQSAAAPYRPATATDAAQALDTTASIASSPVPRHESTRAGRRASIRRLSRPTPVPRRAKPKAQGSRAAEDRSGRPLD